MHTYPLAEYMHHIDSDRWDEVGEMLLSSATKLVAAGAEILVCPDNTAHQGLDLVRGQSPAPWLHIAEEVAAVAAKHKFGRLGILGTRYLMEGPVYPPRLAERRISVEIPDRSDRERLNAVIFDELVRGEFKEGSRAYYRDVIVKLKARGCDAVALACTEIPLLISEGDSPLPIIDSTRAALRAASQAVRPSRT